MLRFRLMEKRGPRMRPQSTLSWMMLRSKSANTDNMPNIALPLGVVVSMPCVLRNKSTLRACSSDRKLTRS